MEYISVPDSFYCIGSSHDFCEDYADADMLSHGAFAALADGCSAGVEPDIGARLLVKSYRKLISTRPCNFDKVSEAAAWWSHGIATQLGLRGDSLYATLLTLREYGDNIVANILGDGVLAARERETGTIHTWQYEYKSGAPYYLNYMLLDSYNDWKEFHSDKCHVTRSAIAPDGTVTEDSTTEFTAKELLNIQTPLSKEDYDMVAVFSDGIETFHTEGETPPYGRPTINVVDYRKSIQELFQIKEGRTGFVRRRTNKFLKKMNKEGVKHYDDFSMAAIFNVEKVR